MIPGSYPGIYAGACFSIVAAFLTRTRSLDRTDMDGFLKRNSDGTWFDYTKTKADTTEKGHGTSSASPPSEPSKQVQFKILSSRPIQLSDGSRGYSPQELESHADIRAVHRRAIEPLCPIQEVHAVEIFRTVGVPSPIKFVGEQIDKVFTNIRSIALSGPFSGVCYTLSHETASDEATILYIHHRAITNYDSGLLICKLADGSLLAYNDGQIGAKLGIRFEQQTIESEAEPAPAKEKSSQWDQERFMTRCLELGCDTAKAEMKLRQLGNPASDEEARNALPMLSLGIRGKTSLDLMHSIYAESDDYTEFCARMAAETICMPEYYLGFWRILSCEASTEA